MKKSNPASAINYLDIIKLTGEKLVLYFTHEEMDNAHDKVQELAQIAAKLNRMALKVVHINKQTIEQEKAAKELWENVLKPKWEARAKAKAEKLFAKLKENGKAPKK